MQQCVNARLEGTWACCLHSDPERGGSNTFAWPSSCESEWRSARLWIDSHFQSVTRQYYIYCCAPTSWHLAAPGCSYVWLTFFWKSGEHIIHRVKSFPGDMNQCVTVLWNGDLPCCCVSKSAFLWRYDAGAESYWECFRENQAQDGRCISLVEMCIILLLHLNAFTCEALVAPTNFAFFSVFLFECKSKHGLKKPQMWNRPPWNMFNWALVNVYSMCSQRLESRVDHMHTYFNTAWSQSIIIS